MKRLKIIFPLILFLSLMLNVLPVTCENTESREARLHQINVFCANASLLTDGETVILIDCGTDTDNHHTSEDLMNYLADSGIDHVDLHILTHYHNDHALPLPEINAAFEDAHTVIYGPSEKLPERFTPLQHGNYCKMKAGDTLTAGAFSLLCVGPESTSGGGEINSDSLNVIIRYGQRSLFVTGDFVSWKVASDYKEEIRNLDVMIWPHHGLKPYAIPDKTVRLINPSLILVPGNHRSMIYWHCRDDIWIKPEVYSNSTGHLIVATDGESLLVYPDVPSGGQNLTGIEPVVIFPPADTIQ